MKNHAVNLVVYDRLKALGYTHRSIITACGFNQSAYYKCRKEFDPEDTVDVDGDIDFDKLVLTKKAQFPVNMDEVMEQLEQGVSIKFLADKYGVNYHTLWVRIDEMRPKKINH